MRVTGRPRSFPRLRRYATTVLPAGLRPRLALRSIDPVLDKARARRKAGVRNDAEIRAPNDVPRLAEVHVIEQIEALSPQFQPYAAFQC